MLIDIDSINIEEPQAHREALERIESGLRKLAHSTARYRCGNCGYGTQRFIWPCPSCKLWETIRPVQRFELESAVV
jgi:lipopolysaccharide biosynthesis regulator YciM